MQKQKSKRKTKNKNTESKNGSFRLPSAVVGIGASAGGLEALEQFFREMNPDSNMAFVIIQHLSPDFKSLMDEILSRHTAMQVKVAEQEMRVQANTVYLIPPKTEMIISGSKLYLSEKEANGPLSLPIDVFFSSLARDQGKKAIGIILSGTGSDGSRGITEISRVGGYIFVQDPTTARFDGMPKMAIETGAANQVTSPQTIPSMLENYVVNTENSIDDLETNRGDYQEIQDVFNLLHGSFDIDFSAYKPSTIIRRLERRMGIKNQKSVLEYIDLLKTDLYELNALYQDLLIEVTEFFRDVEAFDILEKEIIPELFNKKDKKAEVRVWVSACATGEEAYSIAILLDEYQRKNNILADYKIFATDIHRDSLNKASRGVYSGHALKNVNKERLDRYFTPKGSYYQVSQVLRQKIVFAPQNLVKDPPFTRMDLITNRNFLIYLKPHIQKKVISMMHFGLKQDAYLFLGSSEHLGDLESEFITVDSKWKIYKKDRDTKIPIRINLPSTPIIDAPIIGSAFGRNEAPLTYKRLDASLLKIYDSLLNKHLPSSFVINSREELVHIFGEASKYLRPVEGRVSLELLSLINESLRPAFSSILQKLYSEKKSIKYTGITARVGDMVEELDLIAEPLDTQNTNERYYQISLTKLKEAKSEETLDDSLDYKSISSDEAVSLRNELQYTKEYLQTTIEELETSNEELQATNEELQASNEELQSTNEELHSTNEELYTVNSEFQSKIEELTQLNDDMSNLLNSTNIGTIFLDRAFNIRKFTPSAVNLFNLLPQDFGRPISHISHNIKQANLLDGLESVLESGQMIEKEIQHNDGTWFIMRALPYVSNLNSVDGVIVTFIDINQLKQVQAKLEKSEERLRFIMESINDGYWDWDLSSDEEYYSHKFKEMLGYQDHELKNKASTWKELIHPEDLPIALENARKHIKTNGEYPYSQEVRYVHKDGSTSWVLCRGVGVKNDEGVITRMVGTHTDITDLKDAQALLERSNMELQQFSHIASHDLKSPLRHVGSYVELFTDKYGKLLEDKDKKWIHHIETAIERMQNQIDSLLAFAKIGNQELKITSIDLNVSVNNVLEFLGENIKEANAEITVENLGVIDADSIHLERVIQNLIENAIKFRKPDQKLEIKIDMHEEEDQWIISIEDNGIGLDSAYKEKIFLMFKRLNSKDKYSGSGIGLSVCKRILEYHGGSIWVESEKDKGAKFSFGIPKVAVAV